MPGADGLAIDLVQFCSGFHERRLPQEALNAAKRHVIDLIGVGIGGATADSSRIALEHAVEQGGKAEATIWGVRPTLLPATGAAFCNGVFAHALELDDVHTPSSLHPGVVVVPAAIAACEKVGASGEVLLRAVVLGYEVMTRVGMAANPKAHYARGFHPTSTCGCFGALAASGCVLGLTVDQFLNGFGIVASMASGLLEFSYSGSWVKRFHTGWAAQSGLTAALLAKRGFTGPPTALTGPYGFLKAYSDDARPEELSRTLGETYEVCNTQIKYFACCTYQHAALTGVLELVREHGLRHENIARVDVGVVEPAIPLTYEPREAKIRPGSIVDAQFSLPYGIAVSLLFGNASIDQFNESLLKDPAVLSLSERVFVRYEPRLDAYYPRHFPAEVEITLDGGERVRRTVTAPKGHPDNPLTISELEDRFQTLAGRALPQKKVDRLLETLRDLENIDDVRMMGLLWSR